MSDQATYALRFIGGGNRKIQAIKLVRELTQLGLARAKAVVELQEVFARGLDHPAATAIVDRFARECESQVAILDEAEYRYGFDATHPLRGAQPLTRLRWHGLSLAWEHGRIGEWTREREVGFETTQARDQAIADELEAWATKGLEPAERELDIVRRTSAREPMLEQAIREAEAPEEAMAVHADWLQRQGDPRGRVAALDLARAQATGEERARLDQAWIDAMAEHRAHVFGPLSAAQSLTSLTFRGGMIMRIAFDRSRGIEPNWPWPFGDLELFEGLLELPICACVRNVCLRSVAADATGLMDVLMRSDPMLLAGLRELTLSSWSPLGRSVDWSRMPRLEQLEMVVDTMDPIDLPRLRSLVLTLWHPAAGLALRESNLPSLRWLELHDAMSLNDVWQERPLTSALGTLLALPLAASLDGLELSMGVDPFPLTVARVIVEALEKKRVASIAVTSDHFEPEALALLESAAEHLPNLSLG